MGLSAIRREEDNSRMKKTKAQTNVSTKDRCSPVVYNKAECFDFQLSKRHTRKQDGASNPWLSKTNLFHVIKSYTVIIKRFKEQINSKYQKKNYHNEPANLLLSASRRIIKRSEEMFQKQGNRIRYHAISPSDLCLGDDAWVVFLFFKFVKVKNRPHHWNN